MSITDWKTMAKRVASARLPTADAVRVPRPPTPGRYFRWKGALGRLVAAVLLVPGLVIIGLLVLLVRLTSRGPGIYRQTRVGKDGRTFLMYKIRTMRHDAETNSGPVWTQAGDPRTTPVGRVLRRLHLDELPQLFNVLKGEMCLVGPRPERPEFVRVLAEVIPGYTNRLVVLPGITGLAQINLPPDSDLNSVRCKVMLDCEYIAQAGLWLDVRVFLHTALRIPKVPEGWLLVLFGLGQYMATAAMADDFSAGGVGDAAPAQPTPTDILIQAASQAPRHGSEHHRPRTTSQHDHKDSRKPR